MSTQHSGLATALGDFFHSPAGQALEGVLANFLTQGVLLPLASGHSLHLKGTFVNNTVPAAASIALQGLGELSQPPAPVLEGPTGGENAAGQQIPLQEAGEPLVTPPVNQPQ